MIFVNPFNKDEWWELDREKMRLYNYRSGHTDITDEDLLNAEYVECKDWHELYVKKGFCPLIAEIWKHDIWISPEGKYYEGTAHEVEAEYILNVVYGEDVDYCAGDKLEAKGWIRGSAGLMWVVRLDDLRRKTFTQRQYNALFDWCQFHKIYFPNDLETR